MQTRGDLRTALGYMSDGGLSATADLDFYLNAAELELIPLWYEFDPDLFLIARQSAATDSSGILLVPTTWIEMMRVETGDQIRYEQVTLDQKQYASGFLPYGYDVTNKKRKFLMLNSGQPITSTTLYFYTRERLVTGSLITDEPVFPLEFRNLIAYRAAQLYFEDQGPSFYDTAEKRRIMFERRLSDAKLRYERPNQSPQFAQSLDADDAGSNMRVQGHLSYL